MRAIGLRPISALVDITNFFTFDRNRPLHVFDADKVTGNLAGIWLLLAEHLRLKTWDLLCRWTRQPSERAEPRLALQLVHEA